MDTFSREEILKMNKAQMDTFMDNQLRMSLYNESVSQVKQEQIDDLILTLAGDITGSGAEESKEVKLMADAVRATVANLINLYQVGRLTLKGANNLVARGMINAEEFRLITGEDYSGGGSAFIQKH